MKKVLLLSALTIIILVSAGAIYILNNPSCCRASETKTQLNLSAHATTNDFKKALESKDYKLIDIRTTAEFNAGHLNGASQIDFYQTEDFNHYLDSLDKNAKYLIYCRSGNRSGQALQIMREKGFANASDLDGGINAWISNGYPVVK